MPGADDDQPGRRLNQLDEEPEGSSGRVGDLLRPALARFDHPPRDFDCGGVDRRVAERAGDLAVVGNNHSGAGEYVVGALDAEQTDDPCRLAGVEDLENLSGDTTHCLTGSEVWRDAQAANSSGVSRSTRIVGSSTSTCTPEGRCFRTTSFAPCSGPASRISSQIARESSTGWPCSPW